MTYFSKAGKYMTIKGDTVSKDGGDYNWNTAYGVHKIIIGKKDHQVDGKKDHHWTLKVIQRQDNQIYVGIASNTKHCDSHPYYKQDTEYYGFKANGCKYDKKGFSQYSEKYGSGDTVHIILDSKNKTISFGKNGNKPKVAFSNIAPTEYILAVSLSRNGDAVKICKEEFEEKENSRKNTKISSLQKENETLRKRQIFLEAQCKKLERDVADLMDDEKDREINLKRMEKENKELKMKNIDIANYEKWNVEEIILWILSLKQGKYSKYTEKLQKAMVEEGVRGSDLMEIEESNFKMWGIVNFRDRKDLIKEIQKITKQQINDEGAQTIYH